MRLYECVFIARQDVTASQVENMASHFTSLIKEEGGQVGKIEFCGLRTLAYPIKKNKKGHYVLMNVTAEPKTVAEVERQMKLSEDILRYMTVSVESLDDNPSALMQQKSFRDEKAKFSYDEDQNSVPAPESEETSSSQPQEQGA